MNINERIQKIIDELFHGNKRAFSLAVGISATVTENIVGKRKTNPSFDVSSKIASAITDLNAGWLLTGSGEMLTKSRNMDFNGSDKLAEDAIMYKKEYTSTEKPILEVDTESAHAKNFREIIARIDPQNRVNIPLPTAYDFLLRNRGESMVNRHDPSRSIKNNDLVACKLCNEGSPIQWGEVYAVISGNSSMVKKIELSDKEGFIRCVSFNEQNGYAPFELRLSAATDLALVVGVVSINPW